MAFVLPMKVQFAVSIEVMDGFYTASINNLPSVSPVTASSELQVMDMLVERIKLRLPTSKISRSPIILANITPAVFFIMIDIPDSDIIAHLINKDVI